MLSQGLQQKTLHKIHSRHQRILQCHMHVSSAVRKHAETGGATSEELPSLHLGECSPQAAHDLLSPIQSSIGAGHLGLIRAQWQTYLLVANYIFHYLEVQTLPNTSANALTDPSKSAKIANWPTLSTTHEVQQFVRLANYYCCFWYFTTLARPSIVSHREADFSTRLLLVSNMC